MQQDREPGAAFDQDPDRGLPAGAEHEVAFPAAGDRTVGEFRGPVGDAERLAVGAGAPDCAGTRLAAGTPGKRLALPNSRILIHQPYTEGTGGQISDLEIQANEIIRMRGLLERMLADASGKDQAEVSCDIERDKILTAEQAVEYGLIDAVLNSRSGAPALV